MFEKLTGELTAAHQAVVEMGKAAIKPALLEFMEAHPEVCKLRWTSGTPEFNDGDPCEWTLHVPEVMLAAPGPPAGSIVPGDDDDDDDDYRDKYSLPRGLPGREKLKADMESLYAVLEAAEAAVRSMFGDDVEVVIGRDGEATVSEYDMGH